MKKRLRKRPSGIAPGGACFQGPVWKIDSLAMPKFDKFTLPVVDTEVAAE